LSGHSADGASFAGRSGRRQDGVIDVHEQNIAEDEVAGMGWSPNG